MAGWQSGHAADCKSVHLGSTPGPASIDWRSLVNMSARVVKSVDTRDLKSLDHKSCRFESGPGHHLLAPSSKSDFAGIAQLVERDLAKVEVTSSSLVARSKLEKAALCGFFAFNGTESHLSCCLMEFSITEENRPSHGLGQPIWTTNA